MSATWLPRDDTAARKKFESFTFGRPMPSNVQTNSHGHTRSHSRNTSISSTFSVSSKSTNSLDGSSFSTSNPAPTSKRNSHHKRRSSVSTRRESAEMMGVSIPDLPPATSDDNINLGDKDSIRRRALWALEGKPDVPFTKVEIPELSTPVMEKLMSDLSSKQPVSQNSTPTYGQSLGTLMAKRDSFKLLPSSSSSKDQLHTLVEEEEEDEDLQAKPQESLHEIPETAPSVTPALAIAKAPTGRHRPANLSLRPLSLTPENLISAVNGLPTPSLTPVPRPGLKSLALCPSSSIMDDSINITNAATNPKSSSAARPSLSVNIPRNEKPSVPALPTEKSARRSSIRYKSSSTSSTSSNGLPVNFSGLPTPEMTPTSFDRRSSISDSIRNRRSSVGTTSSADDDFFPSHPSQGKSLSASEQHFLFKSHNALLARITDLERALSVRRDSSGLSNAGSSRPVSVASDISSSEYGLGNNEPSDEMLRLIADLKAERDELKRDVDGWRTRVGDMEKQLGILTKRVETERRDAWVARSMVGLLEVEKATLERKLEVFENTLADMEVEKKTLMEVNKVAQEKLSSLEEELQWVQQQLAEETRACQEVVAPVFDADLLATPTPSTTQPRSRPLYFDLKTGTGFTSLDSEGSSTDVDDSFEENTSFSFKSVSEMPEGSLSDEENDLAGYEDEEDSDISFSPSSSFDSSDYSSRVVTHLEIDVSASVTPSSGSSSGMPTVFSRSTSPALDISSRPTHVSRASLSKTWTFPKAIDTSSMKCDSNTEVDRFFGCLDDDGAESSGGSAPASPNSYSYEKHKGLFASGFNYGAEDDNGPFFLPGNVGVEVDEETKGLAAVLEEEGEGDAQARVDEDENMFGEVGGITITFTPPEVGDDVSFDDVQRSSSPVKLVTANSFLDEEDGDTVATEPFNFGRPIVAEYRDIPQVIVSAPSQSGLITPPASLPRPAPSSIPRAAILKSSSSTEIVTSTPPSLIPSASPSTAEFSSFVTPPTKRGGTMPSFIPQAVSSPSPIRSAAVLGKTKPISNSTFIRQPQRKRPVLANNLTGNQEDPSSANVNSAMNARSVLRSSEALAAPSAAWPHPELKSVELPDHHSPRTPPALMREYPVQDRDISCSAPAVTAESPTSSSFSSIMSSPLSARISFQALANFIPAVWSPRSQPTTLSFITPNSNPSTADSERAVESGHRPYIKTERVPMDVPQKRGFVSKKKQLEKLRSRLEREGVKISPHVYCKECDEEAVFL